MDYALFRLALNIHASDMFDNYEQLYELDVDKDLLWDLYLNSIPSEHNKIFRKRRQYDCSTCRHFVKNVGALAAIDGGRLVTVWDVESGDQDFDRVAKILSEYVKRNGIENVFAIKVPNAGTDSNREMTESGEIIKWEHFHVHIPDRYQSSLAASVEAIKGNAKTTRDAFARNLQEVTMDSIETVLELINQGSLYRGEEYKRVVSAFRQWKKEYDKIEDASERDLYIWDKIGKNTDPAALKIRGTAIGTLLIDISEGMDLDSAVKRYEKVVAPTNYKRSKPIFTQEMLASAQKTITELGYMDSLSRRFANADDITVGNILYRNADTARRMDGNIFEMLAKEATGKPRQFSKVEEIGIEDFIKNVVPTATEIEAYVQNKHIPNFCSLIAPVYKDSKTMFKWGNNFSWAYSGNVTDSILKQNVKNAGGNVEGVLRFSIQWNDLDGFDQNDMDAHCKTPHGEIFYRQKMVHGGALDVDIIHPVKGQPAVENITWADMKYLNGKYDFFVHKYTDRGGRSGFRAEIEFDGIIYSYDCRDMFSGNKAVATVTVNNGQFSIRHNMPNSESTKEVWGIHTNTFVPVSVICYSPNYWDHQNGVGNKHYMFMLKDCVNPEMPNAWYNEFLNSDLYPAHRKVMEVMGLKAHVQDTNDQLSGLGFSSTLRNELVVKVKGATERTLKIKF